MFTCIQINFYHYFQLVDTTVEIANKVGSSEIINRIVDDLKDENEQYRKMVMETIEKTMTNLGAAAVDSKLEEQLIDGILYAFQEQTTEVFFVFMKLDYFYDSPIFSRVKYLSFSCSNFGFRMSLC